MDSLGGSHVRSQVAQTMPSYMSVAIESQVVSRSTQARIARLLNSQDRHHAISETMSVGDQNHKQAFQFTEWRPDAIEQSLSGSCIF